MQSLLRVPGRWEWSRWWLLKKRKRSLARVNSCSYNDKGHCYFVLKKIMTHLLNKYLRLDRNIPAVLLNLYKCKLKSLKNDSVLYTWTRKITLKCIFCWWTSLETHSQSVFYHIVVSYFKFRIHQNILRTIDLKAKIVARSYTNIMSSSNWRWTGIFDFFAREN